MTRLRRAYKEEPNMQKKHEEPERTIVVKGERTRRFPFYRWREALMYFLNEVWSEHYDDQDGVIISFYISERTANDISHSVHIRYCTSPESYYAFGSTGNLHPVCPTSDFLTRSVSSVGDFERTIAQFVRSRRYKGLVLPVTDPRHLQGVVFWIRHGTFEVC